MDVLANVITCDNCGIHKLTGLDFTSVQVLVFHIETTGH